MRVARLVYGGADVMFGNKMRHRRVSGGYHMHRAMYYTTAGEMRAGRLHLLLQFALRYVTSQTKLPSNGLMSIRVRELQSKFSDFQIDKNLLFV